METVKDEVGGNNPVLAQTIARQHPGAPGNRVYSHIVWSGYHCNVDYRQYVLTEFPKFVRVQ